MTGTTPAMDALASSMQRRVTEFVVSSPAFQKACNTAFDAIDMRGSGRVPVAHVGLAAACFFQVCLLSYVICWL